VIVLLNRSIVGAPPIRVLVVRHFLGEEFGEEWLGMYELRPTGVSVSSIFDVDRCDAGICFVGSQWRINDDRERSNVEFFDTQWDRGNPQSINEFLVF